MSGKHEKGNPEFSKRLNQAINEVLKHEKSKEKLAEKLGIARQTLYSYLRGERVPDVNFLRKLISVYPQLSLRWLITGEGSPEENMHWHKEEYVFVPLIGDIVLTGEAKVPDQMRAISFYPFKKRWLEDKMTSVPGLDEKFEDDFCYTRRLFLYKARNDDMSPIIKKNDLVLIDCSEHIRCTDIQQGCIYLVKLGYKYAFRRVIRIFIRKGLVAQAMQDIGKISEHEFDMEIATILLFISEIQGPRPKITYTIIPEAWNRKYTEIMLEYIVGKVIWIGRSIECSNYQTLDLEYNLELV